jgi:hypothetical protein
MTRRDGQTRLGGQRWRCHSCRRRFTARSTSAFPGRCFPDDGIALAARWSARFRLSSAGVTARTQSGGERVRAACLTGWASAGDDVVELQRGLVHEAALDEPLQDSLRLRDGRGVEPLPDPGADGRAVRQDGLSHAAVPAAAGLLVALRLQGLPLLRHPLPAGNQLGRADALLLGGVDEPLLGAAEPLQAGGQPPGVGLPRLIARGGHPRDVAELGQQPVRVGEELADVRPDGRLQVRGPHPRAGAGGVPPAGEAVRARAVGGAVLREPCRRAPDVTGHGQAAGAAAEQPAQQLDASKEVS